jgi:predicted dehydrogenase
MNILTEGAPVDHVETQYLYSDFVCTAHGGWVYPDSFPFNMAFQVLGTRGVLEFSVGIEPVLRWYPFEGEPTTPEYEGGTGYQNELAYFAQCVEEGTPPRRVTPQSARESVRVVEAEAASIESREIVIIG